MDIKERVEKIQHQMNKSQELLLQLNSFFKVDFRYLGENLPHYLQSVLEHQSRANLMIEGVFEEIQTIHESMKVDQNFILNLPLVVSYHTLLIKNYEQELQRKWKEEQRLREIEREDRQRKRMKNLMNGNRF